MPTASVTVQSQVDAADSSAATVSDKVKADGYYGNEDGLHTVAYICSSDFVGTIKMQASLATNPESTDWFDIDGCGGVESAMNSSIRLAKLLNWQ